MLLLMMGVALFHLLKHAEIKGERANVDLMLKRMFCFQCVFGIEFYEYYKYKCGFAPV